MYTTSSSQYHPAGDVLYILVELRNVVWKISVAEHQSRLFGAKNQQVAKWQTIAHLRASMSQKYFG